MAKQEQINAADYIVPLYMNGMTGRMLYMPAPPKKKRDILLVYGLHASLERMVGLVADLNQYGAVTLPDLPGFGGMQSFYTIGEKPTLDNLADYLASFIKLRYSRKRVTIMGMSFGFLVVTRMLQKYPELARKVDLLVSVVGFAHYEDFKLKPSTFRFFKYGSSVLALSAPAWMVRHLILRKSFIRATYYLVADKHVKLRDASPEERKKRVDFEIGLWHSNEVRTHMFTTHIMTTVNLCNKSVNLPVYHVAVDEDRYFDNGLVEQHLKVIFSDVHIVPSTIAGHAPTVVANAEEAAPFVPPKLRRLLARAPA